MHECKHSFLTVSDPSLPVAERNKIVIGLCGLLLGFVAVISGLIYYKKTSASYTVFCHSKDNKGSRMYYQVYLLMINICQCDEYMFFLILTGRVLVLVEQLPAEGAT